MMNNQNQNQHNHQQSSEVRHDDDDALSDFLASLMDYTPTIPDELVEHYVAKSGFQCPDVRLIRLVAVATQKFIAEVATDALQHSKARQSAIVKDKKQQKDKLLTLTMDDLSKSLREERPSSTDSSPIPHSLDFSIPPMGWLKEADLEELLTAGVTTSKCARPGLLLLVGQLRPGQSEGILPVMPATNVSFVELIM